MHPNDRNTDGRLDSRDIVSHEDTTGETVAGGLGGAAVGAAWGTLAGPLGTIVGALAGAVGGWWAARSATEQHLFNIDDDTYYRQHHQTLDASVDRTGKSRYSYDDVRPAYQMGHLAGTNPDYAGRSFDEVEPDLRGAYAHTLGPDNWDDVRGYVGAAYNRGRTVSGERLASESTRPTTTDVQRELSGSDKGIADRVVDAADDLKDRMDGNPASRPGRDATDRPER